MVIKLRNKRRLLLKKMMQKEKMILLQKSRQQLIQQPFNKKKILQRVKKHLINSSKRRKNMNKLQIKLGMKVFWVKTRNKQMVGKLILKLKLQDPLMLLQKKGH